MLVGFHDCHSQLASACFLFHLMRPITFCYIALRRCGEMGLIPKCTFVTIRLVRKKSRIQKMLQYPIVFLV
jgi:hypothetical protein